MRKRGTWVFGVLGLLLAIAEAGAQTVPRFSAGAYVSLGVQTHVTAEQGDPEQLGLGGVYAEALVTKRSVPLYAGFDVRSNGTAATLVGTLVGPRLSASLGHVLHPYAEAMFGPNYIEGNQLTVNRTLVTTHTNGVTKEVVVGLDLQFARHWRWRVIEFSDGSFSGTPHSRPRAVTTGIVLHLP